MHLAVNIVHCKPVCEQKVFWPTQIDDDSGWCFVVVGYFRCVCVRVCVFSCARALTVHMLQTTRFTFVRTISVAGGQQRLLLSVAGFCLLPFDNLNDNRSKQMEKSE